MYIKIHITHTHNYGCMYVCINVCVCIYAIWMFVMQVSHSVELIVAS